MRTPEQDHARHAPHQDHARRSATHQRPAKRGWNPLRLVVETMRERRRKA